MKNSGWVLLIILALAAVGVPAADIRYELAVSHDSGSGALSGSMRLVAPASGFAGERTLRFNLRFDHERRLECADWRLNGAPVTAETAAGFAAILLPAGAAGEIVLTCSFTLRDLPEVGGIALLDDNLRDGRWVSWYPRLTNSDATHADYAVDFRAASGSLATPAQARTFEESAAGLRWTMQALDLRNLPLVYSTIFRERRVRVGETDLGLFFREGSELWGEKLLVILAEAEAWYAGNVTGYGHARLDVVLADEEYARGAYPPALPVIRDRTGEMGEEYGGVFVANYLRFQAAVELARAFWTPRLPAHPGGIPWLAEGLALHDAERYARSALLGGPSFENIRQFYLGIAGKADTSLAQPASTADAAGIDPLLVLAQGKGSWVVGMLAAEMGRQSFLAWQRALLERGDAPITTEEIQSTAERAAGRPLNDFFAAWVTGDATVSYGIGSVSEREDGVRVQVLNLGTATPAVELRAVLAEGGEKSEIIRPQGKETWVDLATGGRVISLRLDPDATLPDVNRGDNFRSLGGSERIERLYAIDADWEIGEIGVSMPPRVDDSGRWAEFQLTITNRQEKTGALGLRITAMFPGGRNRGITRLYLEMAPGETRTFRERLELPNLGDGLLQVTAEYFPVYSREGYARIDRSTVPALVNHYAVPVPGAS